VSRADLGTDQGVWFPLKGVKSGQILLNTELLAPGDTPLGYTGDGLDAPVAGEENDGRSRRPGSLAGGKKSGQLGDQDGSLVHVDLIKARDLMKTDLIGKSDPYAVLTYDNQQDKTPTAKNTQNPQWDHSTDFDRASESPILR
jgi:hypothetical protein